MQRTPRWHLGCKPGVSGAGRWFGMLGENILRTRRFKCLTKYEYEEDLSNPLDSAAWAQWLSSRPQARIGWLVCSADGPDQSGWRRKGFGDLSVSGIIRRYENIHHNSSSGRIQSCQIHVAGRRCSSKGTQFLGAWFD